MNAFEQFQLPEQVVSDNGSSFVNAESEEKMI